MSEEVQTKRMLWKISRERLMMLVQQKARAQDQLELLERLFNKIWCDTLTEDDITQLYWSGGYSKLLCKSLGIDKPTILCKHPGIKKPHMELICQECGTAYDHEINSVSDRKTKAKETVFVCDNCESRRQDQNERQWQERERQSLLEIQHLRTMPYKDYLQTAHWRSIRSAALKRARYRCQICNRNGLLNVHHRTYANRGNESWNDVVVLCEDCHQLYHEAVA